MRKKKNNSIVLFSVILLITIAAHITALLVIPYYKQVKLKRKDNTIFKIVDVEEFTPAPPPPEEKKPDTIEIVKQDAVVEDVIETEMLYVDCSSFYIGYPGRGLHASGASTN